MPPVRVITPRRFGDDRGWFCETHSDRNFTRDTGLEIRFVQDNQSLSHPVHTLRGIHFQRPPHAQAKLVRCLKGRIFDVAVDLRRGSPTYAGWVGVELDAASGRQLFIPAGFGHGFVTLEPDTEVFYKVDDFYAADCDGGVRWDDPAIGVDWGLPADVAPALSPKDAALPALAEFDSPFDYDGVPLGPIEA
ncbi:MAG: dTDP-4-dehydrorhamnose 3,5-epimerase [Hyphomicrobiales bacterium]|nr:dTDP-4-dehydrorhamnose 3,5-epimerase [Hyphomicrobiales bacterium]